MIGMVHDEHEKSGQTKAPKVPVPNVDVTAVESKPDPDHVVKNPETIDEADSTKKIPEREDEVSDDKALSKKAPPKSIRAEMLAEVNRDSQ